MVTHVEALQKRARLVHGEIAAIRMEAEEHGADPEPLLGGLYRLLDELYEEGLPLARLADTSDLVARFIGPSVDTALPRMQVVTSFKTHSANRGSDMSDTDDNSQYEIRHILVAAARAVLEGNMSTDRAKAISDLASQCNDGLRIEVDFITSSRSKP